MTAAIATDPGTRAMLPEERPVALEPQMVDRRAPDRAPAVRAFLDRHAGAISYAWLAVLLLCAYARHVWSLGFSVDDWSHLRAIETQPVSVLARQWPLDYRPFDMLSWLPLSRAFAWHPAP